MKEYCCRCTTFGVPGVSSFIAEAMVIVIAAKIQCFHNVITEFKTPFGKDFDSFRLISSIKVTKIILRDKTRFRNTCKPVR